MNADIGSFIRFTGKDTWEWKEPANLHPPPWVNETKSSAPKSRSQREWAHAAERHLS